MLFINKKQLKLSLKIALRYFFSRKKSGKFNAISIISAISLLGYVVGAAALFIVLSVFNGFEDLFSSMYKNFDPDISISINEGKTFNPNQLAIYKIKSINESPVSSCTSLPPWSLGVEIKSMAPGFIAV